MICGVCFIVVSGGERATRWMEKRWCCGMELVQTASPPVRHDVTQATPSHVACFLRPTSHQHSTGPAHHQDTLYVLATASSGFPTHTRQPSSTYERHHRAACGKTTESTIVISLFPVLVGHAWLLGASAMCQPQHLLST